jgi:hypothetical protein
MHFINAMKFKKQKGYFLHKTSLLFWPGKSLKKITFIFCLEH